MQCCTLKVFAKLKELAESHKADENLIFMRSIVRCHIVFLYLRKFNRIESKNYSTIEVNIADPGSLMKSTEYYLILLRTVPINFTV